MDLSQFSTEQLTKLKQKKQLVNSFISGVGEKAKSIVPDRPEPITQESKDKWLATLNPADYQTQLTQEEAQRFSDWAAQNNVPISQDYDMQGLWKNEIAPYDALKGKFTEEQIAGARQGLNGGNVELAKFIDQMGTRKPVTPSEMALAKQGKFNDIPYDAATSHYTDKYKTPWHESFSKGSQYATGDAEKYAGTWDGDNYISPITQATKDNILQQVMSGYGDYANTDKTGWNKVGKGIDVARAIASNPALQGLVAGAVKGKLSGDWGKGLEYGIEWAGNKAKSNYYAQQLGQKPGIIGNYDAKDYTAKATADYQKTKNDIYMANTVSQIDHRLQQLKISWADLERKIKHDQFNEEMAQKKFGLSLQQLQETIRWHKSMESQGQQRINISKGNLAQRQREFEWKKTHPNNNKKQMTVNQYINSKKSIREMANDPTLTDEQVQQLLDLDASLDAQYNLGLIDDGEVRLSEEDFNQ